MKKLILILILLGAAGYFYWPYHATAGFRDALNAEDKTALESTVQWPAVRDSLKEQIQSKFENMARERSASKGELPAPQKAEIAKFVDEMVKATVNAEEMAKNAKHRPGKTDVEKVEIESRTWKSLTEFDVVTNIDKTIYTFRLDGFSGWKVAEVELDDEAFKAAMALAAASAQAETQAQPTPPAGQPQPPTVKPANPLNNNATGQPKKREQWILKGYKNPLDQRAR
jgi:hypothetical protein